MAESRAPQPRAPMETTDGTPYEELPWAVTEAKIQEAVRRIVEVAHPSRVILFGSAARGELHRDSDADFLVVSRQPGIHPRQESVRIRRALRDVSMPMDILVVTEDRLRDLADVPGLIYREVLRSGRTVYEAA